MERLVLLMALLAIIGCKDKKQTSETDEAAGAFNYETFANRFTASKLPYALTDTGLLRNKDTAALRIATFSRFVADSVKQKVFGKTSNIRFIPLAKIEVPKGESYFITKAIGPNSKAALVSVFDKEKNYAATFPLLVPDADEATSQSSIIDKTYTISRNVARKRKDDVTIEGKDVYVYNNDAKTFTLIMTDILDERAQEVINPIDTFARRHKFSGDYVKDKKNIVSIRDGRNPNELLAFVHFEKEETNCTGELKGGLLLTSGTTAVYRQGGDPCVLEFKFTPGGVTLREAEGCGSHRGFNCVFNGMYPRKKEAKTKTSSKKNTR